MALRVGYSSAVISQNMREMVTAGYSKTSALAASFALARVSFFKRHPHGALPTWLAYPKGYRLRQHYDANGKPVQQTPFARNPAPRREIEQAAALFEAFTGKRADRMERIPLQPMPKAGLAFGELLEVGYISFRDGRPYRHTFRKVSSRPLLVASHDGKQVLMLGGAYAFTDRGIEDR